MSLFANLVITHFLDFVSADKSDQIKSGNFNCV